MVAVETLSLNKQAAPVPAQTDIQPDQQYPEIVSLIGEDGLRQLYKAQSDLINAYRLLEAQPKTRMLKDLNVAGVIDKARSAGHSSSINFVVFTTTITEDEPSSQRETRRDFVRAVINSVSALAKNGRVIGEYPDELHLAIARDLTTIEEDQELNRIRIPSLAVLLEDFSRPELSNEEREKILQKAASVIEEIVDPEDASAMLYGLLSLEKAKSGLIQGQSPKDNINLLTPYSRGVEVNQAIMVDNNTLEELILKYRSYALDLARFRMEALGDQFINTINRMLVESYNRSIETVDLDEFPFNLAAGSQKANSSTLLAIFFATTDLRLKLGNLQSELGLFVDETVLNLSPIVAEAVKTSYKSASKYIAERTQIFGKKQIVDGLRQNMRDLLEESGIRQVRKIIEGKKPKDKGHGKDARRSKEDNIYDRLHKAKFKPDGVGITVSILEDRWEEFISQHSRLVERDHQIDEFTSKTGISSGEICNSDFQDLVRFEPLKTLVEIRERILELGTNSAEFITDEQKRKILGVIEKMLIDQAKSA